MAWQGPLTKEGLPLGDTVVQGHQAHLSLFPGTSNPLSKGPNMGRGCSQGPLGPSLTFISGI